MVPVRLSYFKVVLICMLFVFCTASDTTTSAKLQYLQSLEHTSRTSRSPMVHTSSGIAGPKITQVGLMNDFQTKANERGRDCGQSAPVSSLNKILWIFDDTFTPSGLRSATAGWADLATPNQLYEQLDSNSAPLQFYPFTFYEQLYNNQQANAPQCCHNQTSCPDNNRYCHCSANVDCVQRIAHWSSKPFQLNATTVLAFYTTLKIGNAPFDFRSQGLGMAYATYPHTVANRVMSDSSGLYAFYLFDQTDPNWASFMNGRDGYHYFSYNAGFCGTDVYMARVNSLQMFNRSAVEYWNGSGFVKNRQTLQKLTSFDGGLAGCMWSNYLQKYVSFSMGLCNSPKGLFRTADNVFGPWSDATTIDFSPYGAVSGSYAGVLHSELESGNSVVVSYYIPAANLNGAIHMRRIYFSK